MEGRILVALCALFWTVQGRAVTDFFSQPLEYGFSRCFETAPPIIDFGYTGYETFVTPLESKYCTLPSYQKGGAMEICSGCKSSSTTKRGCTNSGYKILPPFADYQCYERSPQKSCGSGGIEYLINLPSCKNFFQNAIPTNTKIMCSKELVLPPMRVELPQNLGYMPAAVPVVASFFEPAARCGVVGASVPVTSPGTCLALSSPVSPDIAPLVRPVIL